MSIRTSRYAILADCLRNATKITIRIQGSVVREQTLDGPVTRGLVRNEIITHGTFTRDDFEEHTVADLAVALREHQVTITVHTKQHPDGELRGHLKPVDEPTIELPDEPADETDEDEDDDRAEFYTFEVTLTVVDEDGDPVEGELVERRTVGRVDWIEVGRTDENGEIVLTSGSSLPDNATMVEVRVREQTITISIGPEEHTSVNSSKSPLRTNLAAMRRTRRTKRCQSASLGK